jgi:hypothetical protein
MPKALEVIADARGTIVAGFIAADVFYLRATGEISAALGNRCSTQLRRHLGGSNETTCFFDFSAALGSDFAARAAITRALVANRRPRPSINALVRSGAMLARARAMIPILGDLVQLLDDPAPFHEALNAAAPSAQSKLPPSRCIPVRSERGVASHSRRSRGRAHTYA